MSTIEFPGLWGWSIDVNTVAFTVYNVPIYWYGIIIALAFLSAIFFALRDSQKFGFEQETIIDLALVIIPAAIIGARLYYVAFSWEEFKDNPISILNTRTGGLAIYGGIVGALLAAYVFSRVKKINVLDLFDFAIPYLALGQAIGRWGNFINQEAYGINTSLPWGMTSDSIKQDLLRNMQKLSSQGITVDPNIPVHPTFLYESLWDFLVFFLLFWGRKRRKFSGEIFYLYMMLYGTGRFFIEGLRTDSLMIGTLRASQLLAFVFVAVFGILFVSGRRKSIESEENTEVSSSPYGVVLKKLEQDYVEGNDTQSHVLLDNEIDKDESDKE